MKAKFSASVKTFYAQNMIDDGSYDIGLPVDLIDVTDEELSTYWKQSPPLRKMLGVIGGRPAWVDLPPPTHEELIANADAKKIQLKAIVDSEIEWRQDAVEEGNPSEKEIADLASWRKYRVALMRIDISKTSNIDWPVFPE